MSKREMIDRIMARNPSARPEFLADFSEEELGAYLHQLESVGDTPPSAHGALPHVRDDVGYDHASACPAG
jgi:hypothetical protein